MPITQQKAADAYDLVLENAGSTLPKRDAVDSRVVQDTRNGTATYEGKSYKISHKTASDGQISGIIDSQNDVGGWPALKGVPAPKDADHDGMPDDWETKNGLDPTDPSDRNNVAPNGYTMLENYLNSIR